MDLTGILSVSGYSGLFKLIKQSKTGFIVESLIDQKRMQTFASSKISTLEDIAIFTETGEVHLKDVFRKIFSQEEGKSLRLDAKSSGEELKVYFEKILPDFDKERVYVSDIRKVILWYNLLVDKGLIDLVEDEEKAEEPIAEDKSGGEMKETETIEETVKEVKPKKKTTKKSKNEDIE